MPNDEGSLAGARERIEAHRKGRLDIVVAGPDGAPLPHRAVRLEQRDSAFLFGCNIFRLDPQDESREQKEYQRLFCDLLNYATLPFYWGSYEAEPGKTREARLRAMASWCAEHGLRSKGHPLVWHEVYPAWADAQEAPALKLQQKRTRQIVKDFRGLVDMWDVINESSVSHRFDNAIGKWAREVGAVKAAAEALRWARSANRKAVLLVNDYNVSPEYEAQIEGLTAGDHKPDAIGIQTHMHTSERPLDQVWGICETYARFGLPLHFTELTVLSGHYISPNVAWSGYREENWPSTPAGEEKQLRYLERFYTLLFSHPAVAAITCWDFADGGWMNAPAGLVRRDMSPKPIYDRLKELIRREWRTNVTLTTDAAGRAEVNAFYGRYVVTDTESGMQVQAEHAPKKRARVAVKPG
jgi:GH35 family endo-1,4-beta-xylanase